MAPEIDLTAPAQFPQALHDPLVERGFVLDGRTYRRAGLSFAAVGRWFVFDERPDGQGQWSLSSGLTQLGLWKWVGNGSPPHRVFEIPAWAVDGPADGDRCDGDGPASFAPLLDWALASSVHRLPPDWQSPARDMVESWMPRGALTVPADGLVRQGELILQPDRWALRVPIVPQLPGDLPVARSRALRELVFDAQCRWAMVRFGLAAETAPTALVAEVDFTGAPHSGLLFLAGLDVLKHVGASLVETADVLADPTVEIECLPPGCPNPTPKERNQI
jgi:hypothetical protein